MTESRNGASRAPTGERGVSVAGNLAHGGLAIDSRVMEWGLRDFTRPSSRDVEEMIARDGMAQALYYLLTFLVGDASVHVEGEGPKADHVRKNLLGDKNGGGMSTPMTTVLKQMASAIALKRAPFEKVWEYREGKVWLKKLKLLPVTTCKILPDKTGGYNGFRQETTHSVLSGQKPPRFDPKKSFVYFHDGSLAPLEGRSALTAAWHEHENKKKTRDRLHIHLSLHALGVKVGKTNGDEENQESLLKRLHSVEGGGSVILGEEEELQLLTGGSTQEFTPYISMINREMSTSTLMQWLGLGGSEGTGAQSLSRDHSSFTVSQADGTLRQMGEDFTRYVVSDMVGYNFGPNAGGDDPEVTFGPISEHAQQIALDMLKVVAVAPQTRFTDKEIAEIKRKGLSPMDIEIDEDEQSPQPSQQPTQQGDSEEDDELERARQILRSGNGS